MSRSSSKTSLSMVMIWRFGRHLTPAIEREDGTTWYYWGGIGSWISGRRYDLDDGERHLYSRAMTVWLRVEGTATLKNVLFENSKTRQELGPYPRPSKASLYVTKTGKRHAQQCRFPRSLSASVIAIEKGGSLSTTGCLSFIRTFIHNVRITAASTADFGTWRESSSPPNPCPSDMRYWQ